MARVNMQELLQLDVAIGAIQCMALEELSMGHLIAVQTHVPNSSSA